jgi:hypothetical protein
MNKHKSCSHEHCGKHIESLPSDFHVIDSF